VDQYPTSRNFGSTLVALSTTEVEHISAAGKEMLWMCHFMGELGYKMPGPSLL
jgi:hypothetical protein